MRPWGILRFQDGAAVRSVLFLHGLFQPGAGFVDMNVGQVLKEEWKGWLAAFI